jgi:hypothetical protein
MITPGITAIVIAVLAAVAFGGGFALADWRVSGQIARLNANNAILSAANLQCATDIQTARSAMAAIMAAAAAKEKRAEEAQRAAEPQAKQHTIRAKRYLALPPVPMNMQCEAIKQEQMLYVQGRAD